MENGSSSVAVELSSQEPARRSYQIRALARKTLSLQKRQWCTNICCVALCPFLMVALCGVLTIAIAALLAKQFPDNNVVYCSDVFPSDSGSGDAKITYTNQHTNGPCVQWLGPDYPLDPIYAPNVTVACPPSLNPQLCPLVDSTTLPAPATGYIGSTDPQDAFIGFSSLLLNQIYFWGLYYAPESLLPALGYRKKGSEIPLAPPESATVQDADGFFAGIPTEFQCLSQNASMIADPTSVKFLEQPYYVLSNATSADGVDVELNDILNQIVYGISRLDRPVDPQSGSPKAIEYAIGIYNLTLLLPPAVVLFEELAKNGYQYKYTLQIGTSDRLLYENSNSPLPAYATEGLRRLVQQSKLSNAILRSRSADFENTTITQGLRMMPELVNTGIDFPIGSFIGEILYPFGVSFLLPIFVLNIVKEKEERVLIMMKMNGLKTWAYFLTQFLHFYALHILSSVVFIITGLIFRLNFFTLTDPGVYIVLFIIWGFVQIAMAFFFAPFFKRSRFALACVLCLVILSVIINMATPTLFADGRAPLGYLIYPPFAFYRALQVVNIASFTTGTKSYTMAMVVAGDEVFDCIMFMIVETIIISLLAAYLTMVFPSEFGIQRKWHFPVSYLVKYAKKRMAKNSDDNVQLQVMSNVVESDDAVDDDADLEDDDVKAERRRILNGNYDPKSPLVMKGMRKIFGSQVAVRDITMGVDSNTVFGLLGPNGAGKTTLISILVGLFESSAGKAYLSGYEVGPEMAEVYRMIGVCPQHDILWTDLTVEEHLLFYARLKGVSPSEEKQVVQNMLKNVSLLKHSAHLSKNLSGGEKRRLSIAIALIGDCKVVFLDEPTTGLDPEVRRLIWNIISSQRAGKVIILTTHSMEEAEVLCQKIGIMAKGSLRCFGSQLRLKSLYGSGFRLSASCSQDRMKDASAYLESVLPSGWKKLDNYSSNVLYEFPMEDKHAIADLFQMIEDHKEEHGITDWGVSQTSLEDVFLRLVRDTDVQAD